jgi:hypothetical protein
MLQTYNRLQQAHRNVCAIAPVCAAIVLLFSSFAPPAWAAAEEVTEYDLKAALLIKITAFVTWPDGGEEVIPATDNKDAAAGDNLPAVETHSSTDKIEEHFCIGIIGADPFGASFDSLLEKTNTEHRKLTARRVASAEEAQDCQVLFVAQSAREQARNIVANSHGPVLTMADFPGFAESGGMVEMARDGNRIALIINRDAVNRAGLSVSSKLLSLAKVIGDGHEAGANERP